VIANDLFVFLMLISRRRQIEMRAPCSVHRGVMTTDLTADIIITIDTITRQCRKITRQRRVLYRYR